MAYGNLVDSVSSRMGSKKKKPAFLDDTSGTSGGDERDDTVDASGADEVIAGMDKTPSQPVNASPEDETALADEGEGGELGSYGDVESDAAGELASLAGVKDVGAFKAALGDYVEACVKRALEGQK